MNAAGRGRPRKAAPQGAPGFPVFSSCGELYQLLSRSGHPCGRDAGHPADPMGHVCPCEAELILQTPISRTAAGDVR